jgi:hypothetical protein
MAVTSIVVELSAQAPQEKEKQLPAPTPVAPPSNAGFVLSDSITGIVVKPASFAPPSKASFVLGDRHGHATPTRTHEAHTGGGNTDVAQPREDTLIVSMTGVATAGPNPFKPNAAAIDFELDQAFSIGFSDPKLKNAKLTVEAQVIGLLRGDKDGGSATVSNCGVFIHRGPEQVLTLATDQHTVECDEHLAINDHKGPTSVLVPAGDYRLVQNFHISAAHSRSICGKAAAAEFAPDPTLDPTWISITDPFRGANKKEFGFRVTLHVEPE